MTAAVAKKPKYSNRPIFNSENSLELLNENFAHFKRSKALAFSSSSDEQFEEAKCAYEKLVKQLSNSSGRKDTSNEELIEKGTNSDKIATLSLSFQECPCARLNYLERLIDFLKSSKLNSLSNIFDALVESFISVFESYKPGNASNKNASFENNSDLTLPFAYFAFKVEFLYQIFIANIIKNSTKQKEFIQLKAIQCFKTLLSVTPLHSKIISNCLLNVLASARKEVANKSMLLLSELALKNKRVRLVVAECIIEKLHTEALKNKRDKLISIVKTVMQHDPQFSKSKKLSKDFNKILGESSNLSLNSSKSVAQSLVSNLDLKKLDSKQVYKYKHLANSSKITVAMSYLSSLIDISKERPDLMDKKEMLKVLHERLWKFETSQLTKMHIGELIFKLNKGFESDMPENMKFFNSLILNLLLLSDCPSHIITALNQITKICFSVKDTVIAKNDTSKMTNSEPLWQSSLYSKHYCVDISAQYSAFLSQKKHSNNDANAQSNALNLMNIVKACSGNSQALFGLNSKSKKAKHVNKNSKNGIDEDNDNASIDSMEFLEMLSD